VIAPPHAIIAAIHPRPEAGRMSDPVLPIPATVPPQSGPRPQAEAASALPATALRKLLDRAGYEIRFSQEGWIECFVRRDEESWSGHGVSEDDALVDAVAHMLPSHLAQGLLGHAAERDAEANRAAVMAGLSATTSEVEARLPALARAAPDVQRALMLVWICRARGLHEGLPGDPEAEAQTKAIADRLGELAKLFWPGSVRALQLNAKPADIPSLRVSWAPVPATWAEARVIAERVLEKQITEGQAEGLDEGGWAKEPEGAEPNADAQLATNAAQIENLLTQKPGERLNLDEAAVTKLVTAARRLRRLRGKVADDVAWATALGRLRRAVPDLGGKGAKLKEALDPKIKPQKGW
jgi:hypothetical protein